MSNYILELPDDIYYLLLIFLDERELLSVGRVRKIKYKKLLSIKNPEIFEIILLQRDIDIMFTKYSYKELFHILINYKTTEDLLKEYKRGKNNNSLGKILYANECTKIIPSKIKDLLELSLDYRVLHANLLLRDISSDDTNFINWVKNEPLIDDPMIENNYGVLEMYIFQSINFIIYFEEIPINYLKDKYDCIVKMYENWSRSENDDVIFDGIKKALKKKLLEKNIII